MNDAALELRLLQYIRYKPKEIFERTDEEYFFAQEYRNVYNIFAKYYFAFGSIPQLASLHAHFDVPVEFSIAENILSSEDELELSELEFLLQRLGELRIARSLRPIILNAVDEIGHGHGVKALEIVESGIIGVQRSMRRTSKVEDSIEGDVKASLLLRSEDLEKEESDSKRTFKTGFSKFDEYTGGFREGQLIIVTSPTGEGKSIVMMNIGARMYLNGLNVIYVSLEMARREWELRFDSWLSGIEFRKFYTGILDRDEKRQFKVAHVENLLEPDENELFFDWFKTDGSDKLYSMTLKTFISEYMRDCKFRDNIYYPLDIPRGCSLETMETRVNYIRQKWGCDVLIIDYPGIMEYGTRGKAGWENLADLFGELKGFARFYGIPVICAAQLKDEEVGREERLSSRLVRFSRAILDHSDLTLGWIRTSEDIRKKRMTIKPLKVRNIPFGFELICDADFNYMRIEERELKIYS